MGSCPTIFMMPFQRINNNILHYIISQQHLPIIDGGSEKVHGQKLRVVGEDANHGQKKFSRQNSSLRLSEVLREVSMALSWL